MRVCVLLVVIACAAAWPAWAQKRVALVIGNDAYLSVPRLRKAANDARAMAATLEGLGFEVIVSENLTQRAMSQVLARLDAAVAPGDMALLFFAGHGFEIRGLNYLLPVDVPAAGEGQEEIVRDASFAVDRLVERLQRRGAATTILVLDACRDNPFEQPGRRSVGGAQGGLAPMTPPEGVFVVYSAGARQEALDQLSDNDADPNSVFTRNFVRDLRVPGLTLVQIAKRTQAAVRQLAATVHHDQTPAYYDEIVGDVVLDGVAAPQPSPAPGPRSDATAGRSDGAAPEPGAAPRPDLRTPGVQYAILAPHVQALPPANAPVAGPLVSFTRSGADWQANVSLPEPALAISWRLGGDGDFQETGVLDVIDQRTGRRQPSPSFQFAADTPARTIFVRYVDPAGMLVGPFAIAFEPRAALVREERRYLDMIAGSWLAFGGYDGALVYYTMLVTYRCAIRELRIGLDSPVPNRVVPLPPCDDANPFATPGDFQPYLRAAAGLRSASVQIVYDDGSLSPVRSFRR